ncbi:uncharacterized protein LOC143145189 isoform X2 [Ptiloglossa arizonensis]|uniref:uncharacterized protein LOC143145189 isoform X2 n=1 Tax=Ptiloglossa arizonensis TaxID=3350558 RepID=UPI003F9F4D86
MHAGVLRSSCNHSRRFGSIFALALSVEGVTGEPRGTGGTGGSRERREIRGRDEGETGEPGETRESRASPHRGFLVLARKRERSRPNARDQREKRIVSYCDSRSKLKKKNNNKYHLGMFDRDADGTDTQGDPI